MKLPEAQFPFWLGAVLCVEWGQRSSAGSGKEVVKVASRRGSKFTRVARDSEVSWRFCLDYCCNDCLCNMDLSHGDLWGSLVTRDLGNTGPGWLLLDRLVRSLLSEVLSQLGDIFTQGPA